MNKAVFLGGFPLNPIMTKLKKSRQWSSFNVITSLRQADVNHYSQNYILKPELTLQL